MNTTPEELKLLRTSLGWTQAETAKKLQVAPITYHRWEHGQTAMPRAHQLMFRLITDSYQRDPQKIAQALHRDDWAPGEIRRLREHMNQTQAILARELNVCRGTVAAWEAGTRKPSMDNLRKLDEMRELG